MLGDTHGLRSHPVAGAIDKAFGVAERAGRPMMVGMVKRCRPVNLRPLAQISPALRSQGKLQAAHQLVRLRKAARSGFIHDRREILMRVVRGLYTWDASVGATAERVAEQISRRSSLTSSPVSPSDRPRLCRT